MAGENVRQIEAQNYLSLVSKGYFRFLPTIIISFLLGALVSGLYYMKPISAPEHLYVMSLSKLLQLEEDRVLKARDEQGMFYGHAQMPKLFASSLKTLEQKYEAKIYEKDNALQFIDLTEEVHLLLLDKIVKSNSKSQTN